MNKCFELGGVSCAILVFLAAVGGRQDIDVAHPMRVLRDDFDDKVYWPAPTPAPAPGQETIEFCGGDWCQEVRFPKDAMVEAEQALFLMFHYFDATDAARAPRDALALRILDTAGGDRCAKGEQQARAACVLMALQERHGLAYRRVDYDIGYRCSSMFVAKPPYFTRRGACVRVPIDTGD